MTAESGCSVATFFLGGYASDPVNIDGGYVFTGLAGQETLSSSLELYGLKVGNRLDPEGGATGSFEIQITQQYFDNGEVLYRRDPGILTIYNTDGPDGTGSQYVVLMTWSGTQTGFEMSDGTMIGDTVIYGASAIGDNVYNYTLPEGISTASYSGIMIGQYFDGITLSDATGTASVSVDFGSGMMDGRVSEIQSGAVLIPDVILNPDGSAETDAAVGGRADLTMTGDYTMVIVGPEAVAGAFAVTDGESGLVGAIDAER